MTDTIIQHIRFEGLQAPLRIAAPDIVRPLLDPVLRAWPCEAVATGHDDPTPFASLRPQSARRWCLEAPLAVNPTASHNPISAICDLIVEMSWERLRSRPELLCLHAAAVRFGDRLVVFPNTRRAGKSLLSAALARLGHPVFTDDFVPFAVDQETQVISGIANGIAPRLRLPLPATMSDALRDWITDRMAVRNAQYGYLTEVALPQSGTIAPVGAIVVLDRDADLTEPAALVPVTRAEAMASLVRQNFGRQVHAGAILRMMDALTRGVPMLRLRYNGVEEAAALLHDSALLRDLPRARMTGTATSGPLPLAPLDLPDVVRDVPVDLGQVFAKRPDFAEVETETSLYLADADGVAIHRLNPVSAIIWTLLDGQVNGAAIVAVMHDLYADVAVTQLQADVAAALAFLWDARLVVPT